jgi:hypothetical protein
MSLVVVAKLKGMILFCVGILSSFIFVRTGLANGIVLGCALDDRGFKYW